MTTKTTPDLIYLDIDASLKRFCVQWGHDTSRNLSYLEIDAHADDSTVPAGDFIGLSGLSLSTNGPFQTVEVMIGVAVQNDTNLKRLRSLVAQLYQQLQPTKFIPVVDYETGDQKGHLYVRDGIKILPVGGEGVRPLQYLMISFLTDCFAQDSSTPP